jgi:hypothetical protein
MSDDEIKHFNAEGDMYWEQVDAVARVQQERLLAEQAREAELELLDTAESTEDYIRRRRAMPYLITCAPETPLEDMSTADYRKARMRDRSSYKEHLRMGETSIDQYLRSEKK